MFKLIKILLVVAVFGIVIQSFSDKPDQNEPSFSNDWNEAKTAVNSLEALD